MTIQVLKFQLLCPMRIGRELSGGVRTHPECPAIVKQHMSLLVYLGKANPLEVNRIDTSEAFTIFYLGWFLASVLNIYTVICSWPSLRNPPRWPTHLRKEVNMAAVTKLFASLCNKWEANEWAWHIHTQSCLTSFQWLLDRFGVSVLTWETMS